MYEKGTALITITESMYDRLLDEVKALKEENDKLQEVNKGLRRLNENQFNLIVEKDKEIFELDKELNRAHNACPVEVRLEDQRRSYRANLKTKDETIQRLRQSYFAERLKRMTLEQALDSKIIEQVTKLMEKEGDKDDG